MTREELRALAVNFGASVHPKEDARIMRAIDWIARTLVCNPGFMRYWTTLGRRIYFPSGVEDPYHHPQIMEHELVHVAQWDRWGWFFVASYLLLPVPFGLAWFRWRWEREAYMVQLRSVRPEFLEVQIDRVVDRLWCDYLWTWPRPLMRRWFRRACGVTS